MQLRLFRSHDEASRRAARVYRLLPITSVLFPYELVRDRTRLNQINHAITEHLAVHTKTLVVLQVRHDSVGNHADSSLKGRTILHKIIGNQLTNLVLHFILCYRLYTWREQTGKNVLGQLRINVANFVDIADVNDSITRAARHARVDLGDNNVGTLGSSTSGFDARTHGAEAVLIYTLQR